MSLALELWFSNVSCDPFGGPVQFFRRSHLKPSENIDVYSMIHNSSNISVMKQQQKTLWLMGSPQHEELCESVGALERFRATTLE